MSSKDDQCTIVFNGEIYNFHELRAELEQNGFRFRGRSDTEVALAAYRAWGVGCLDRFNGMYAFAVYDRGSRGMGERVFLARDRVGKKPLYYSLGAKSLEFASELKSIAPQAELNIQALNHYLALGYVPGSHCLAAGVNKLPPAHAAVFDIATRRLNVWRYWQLPARQSSFVCNEDELIEGVEALLRDSVELRLRSDVPVGVLLSGGLDSSLVVANVAAVTGRAVPTFTISFPGTALDEASYADRVARHFGTRHEVLEVQGDVIADAISEYARFVDEPLADSSVIPSYIVCKLIRKHVKVALGGDGGDELFGGYSDYPAAMLDQQRFGRTPVSVWRLLSRLAAMLPAGVRGRNRIAGLRGGPLQQMVWGSPYFDTALRKRILNEEPVAALGSDFEAPEGWLLSLYKEGADPIDCMTRTHFYSILPDDFLVKVDRASMANGLEVRCPLLDYRLVEFAFRHIPSHWKVRGRETRRLEKIIGRRALPATLDINRKQGFSLPLDEWFRGTGCALVHDHIEYLPEVINRREVTRLIDGQIRGRANGSRLFCILMLALSAKNRAA